MATQPHLYQITISAAITSCSILQGSQRARINPTPAGRRSSAGFTIRTPAAPPFDDIDGSEEEDDDLEYLEQLYFGRDDEVQPTQPSNKGNTPYITTV